MNMRSWHVVQEVIVKSKNGIVCAKDEIVTLPSLASKIPDSKMFTQGRGSFQ